MRTPSSWSKNLNNNIITMEMLENSLFSLNKRAKNYRDKKQEYYDDLQLRRAYYGYACDYYDNIAKYKEKEHQMYALKEELLSYVNPTCIHKETFYQNVGRRIYSNEENYEEIKAKYSLREGKNKKGRRYVKLVERKPYKTNYYLFYEIGSHSFHTPIKKEDIKKYNLDIIEIDNLKTKGKNIQDLASMQFVYKVIDCLKNGGQLVMVA